MTPIEVELTEPVTVGKETYSKLTFGRYITGADLVASDAVQGATRRDYALHASLAGVPMQVFLGMRGSDVRRVREAVAPIMGEFLGIELSGESPEASPQNGAS